MRDSFLEGRTTQRLIARLAPPFDREIVEARFGEMMGDRLRLRAAFAQDFRGAAVQRLAAALEQAFISGVLDQRVLEAISRLRRGAFNEKEIDVGKALESGSESGVVDLCDGSQQRMGEAASQDRADLGDLAG